MECTVTCLCEPFNIRLRERHLGVEAACTAGVVLADVSCPALLFQPAGEGFKHFALFIRERKLTGIRAEIVQSNLTILAGNKGVGAAGSGTDRVNRAHFIIQENAALFVLAQVGPIVLVFHKI